MIAMPDFGELLLPAFNNSIEIACATIPDADNTLRKEALAAAKSKILIGARS